MGQPVADTLELADALRRTGMDRDQAHGLARALGRELGEHVPVRGDLEALRSDIDSQFQALRSDVDSRFHALDVKFTAKLNVLTTAVALMLAFLAVLTGLNLFPRGPAEAAPAPSPVTVYVSPDGWSATRTGVAGPASASADPRAPAGAH